MSSLLPFTVKTNRPFWTKPWKRWHFNENNKFLLISAFEKSPNLFLTINSCLFHCAHHLGAKSRPESEGQRCRASRASRLAGDARDGFSIICRSFTAGVSFVKSWRHFAAINRSLYFPDFKKKGKCVSMDGINYFESVMIKIHLRNPLKSV